MNPKINVAMLLALIFAVTVQCRNVDIETNDIDGDDGDDGKFTTLNQLQLK